MPVAFPGAEGFGKDAVGGRGGTVYVVSNLNNSGAGSFREAVEASGARIVVFSIGGTIVLESRLNIDNPNLTIAGQTAPGGGITIRGDGTFDQVILSVFASEVIMRYFRVRAGATVATTSQNCISIGNTGLGINNVMLDHLSLSWAVDQLSTMWYDSFNVTYQWCIFSEALHDSSHSSGPHSAGFISGSSVDSLSMHHNLFAHNNGRNPRLQTGLTDVVNNVIYNSGYKEATTWGPSHSNSGATINYVGNYFKAGPDTDPTTHMVSGPGNYYVQGNITPDRPVDTGSETVGVVRSSDIATRVVGTRYSDAPQVTTDSPTDAYARVLEGVGANRSLNADGSSANNRDPVDDRIISDVDAGTGAIIDDEDDVGGWPTLAAGTAYTDADSDGIPDFYEDLYRIHPGLDKADGTDGAEIANNGYSHVENFFNFVALRSAVPGPGRTRRKRDVRDLAGEQRSLRKREEEWKRHVVAVEAQMKEKQRETNRAREKTQTKKVPEGDFAKFKVAEKKTESKGPVITDVYLYPERKK